jgi:hypothetical protein
LVFHTPPWEPDTWKGFLSLDPPLLTQGCLAMPSIPRGKYSGQE